MTSISETLFDTYGDSLMQEYAPYDEAEILAALDRMSIRRTCRSRSVISSPAAISAGAQLPSPSAWGWASR